MSTLALSPINPHATNAQSLTHHDPIYIFGDRGFTLANGVVNGDGTTLNPYVIAGWDINSTAGSVQGSAIQITNTHAYFIIRDNYIHTPPSTTQTTGVYIENSPNGIVANVQVTGPYFGISVSTSPSSIIENNNVWNTTVGISLASGSSYSLASNNLVRNSTQTGMFISGIDRTTIIGNTITCVGVTCTGFSITATNSIFDGNSAANGRSCLGVTLPLIPLCYGYRIISTTDSVFRNNTILNNAFGFIVNGGDYRNIIEGNHATGNQYGIGLEGTSTFQNGNNTLSENILTDNLYGIYSTQGVQNKIYDNYLNNTVLNANSDNPLNSWNTTKTLGRNILGGPFLGGNFYSDYHGTDPDGDGIGDTPYGNTGTLSNVDALPLMFAQPGVVHDIAVTGLTVQPPGGLTGTSFTITVSLSNIGSTGETFPVNAYYNQTLIGTRTITNLQAQTQTTATISWDTSTVAPGNYSITAKVPPVLGENNTANNNSPPTLVELKPHTHDIAALGVTAQPVSVKIGATITFTITIANLGNDTETFNVNLFANQTLIGTKNIPSLPPTFQTSTTMKWETTGFQAGNYSIIAKVPPVNGETNIANNNSPAIIVRLNLDKPPVAVFTSSANSTTVRSSVMFNATASYDPDGNLVSYSWNFGDNSALVTGRLQTHSYSLAGTYRVILVVTDDNGKMTNSTRVITVSAFPPSPPLGLKVSYANGTIVLSWNPPSDDGGAAITAYRIYRGVNPTNLRPIRTITWTVTSYTDDLVSNGQVYYYNVTAVNSGGESLPSNQQNFTVPLPPTPSEDSTLLLASVGGAIFILFLGSLVFVWRRRTRKTRSK